MDFCGRTDAQDSMLLPSAMKFVSTTPMSQATTEPGTPGGALVSASFEAFSLDDSGEFSSGDMPCEPPALTPDGRVLELNKGNLVVLPIATRATNAAKEQAQMVAAMHIAHSACEADRRLAEEEGCWLDGSGVIQVGGISGQPTNCAARLKALRSKILKRRGSEPGNEQSLLLCVQPNGRVCIYLQPTAEGAKRRCVAPPQSQPSVLCDEAIPLDLHGVLHWQCDDESSQGVAESDFINDSPALTPDGSVVDLGSSQAIFFSYAENGGQVRRADAELLRAVRLAHAACDAESRIEAEAACCIDAAGTIQAGQLSGELEGQASRLRTFRSKKLQHREVACGEMPLLVVQPSGRVCISLRVSFATAPRKERLSRPTHTSTFRDYAAAIDGKGIVHWQCAAESIEETEIEAINDGPALTLDGSVVDLEGSQAIFFSCAENGGRLDKQHAEMIRAMRVAHAACEAESRLQAEEVCCLDAHGVIQSGLPSGGCSSDNGIRQRMLRMKRLQRRRPRPPTDSLVLAISQDGRALVFMQLTDESGKRRQRRLLDVKRRCEIGPSDACIPSVDSNGALHW